MKLLIDLQACQSPASRNRGIGRYSHSLAHSVARQAGNHDLWLFLTDVHSDGIEAIRQSFDGLVPNEKIIVWRAPELTSEFDRQAIERRLTVEAAREAFLASLNPDFVHVSSLFETHDNCITSIGHIDPRPKTAVTLYDLIPLVHKERYLSDDNARWWYMRKIEQLKKADLLFAISEHSRKEAIEYLSVPQNSVVTIWGAADQQFKKITLSVDEIAGVRGRYGLTKPFLMYTGGIDHRKNMEGLVSAYARLPASTRQKHQLAIVCKVSESERDYLMSFSAKEGLTQNELVITGYVPENDLVALYNICELFVFPSWHEGFGLPVLEAMACGAPVIAANATSLPEIVGRADALFDPHDLDSIGAKIQQALIDGAFRTSLIESGLERARSFTWDNTAKITLAAFEEKSQRNVSSDNLTLPSLAPIKPRLAYVSPMPPERTGVAGYSADLLPSLVRHFEIDVIVDQAHVDPKALPEACSVRDAQWFREHGAEYDHIVYHFGNSLFHRYMYDLLREHPGIVVLHDFFLSGSPAHLELSGEVPGMWGHTLFDSHGYRGLRDLTSTHDYLSIIRKYPCNSEVLRCATGVIVHSEYSADLAREWYGQSAANNWHLIPLQRVHQHIEKVDARIALGIEPDVFLVCAFGSLSRPKLNDKLLDAWLNSPLASDDRTKLVFVGEHGDPSYAAELDLQQRSNNGPVKNVSVTGFADDNNYALYLAAADIGVQLRGFSRGETSGAALDCMAYGLPLIVNAHAAMAELPTHAVLKIPDLFSRDQLVRALMELRYDAVRREILSYESFNWIKRNHSPDGVADLYRDAIIESSKNPKSLLRTISAIGSESTAPSPQWRDLASASLSVMAPLYGAKQIFVDVSVLVNVNAGTGIQRVTIGLLKAMLLNPLPGIRIEPVYVGAEDKFWYARRFCVSFMDYGYSGFALGLKDEPIQVHAGDILLGLDLVSNHLGQKKKIYQSVKDLGAKLAFIVYDLLPYLQPNWFQKEDAERFASWLSIVNEIADEVLCISKTVANDFIDYQKANVNPIAGRKLTVRDFQVGTVYADGRDHRRWQLQVKPARLDALRSVAGAQPAAIDIRDIEAKFLLLGTIEPRKGHAQAIDAFEILWKNGCKAQLVIVGRPGWMTEQICTRIQEHAEFGQRLHWHKNLPDDRLPEFYQTSSALLLASFGEGLGMPLLEAATFGLPVIARDIPVFREIAGDAAVYFSGSDGEALSKTLETWLQDFALGNIVDSFSIATIGWHTSANQVMTLLGLSDAPRTYDDAMKRGPQDIERTISFGRALDDVLTAESTTFAGTVSEGIEGGELVVGLERQHEGQSVLLQENLIVLTSKAAPLKINFEFTDVDLSASVSVGSAVQTFHVPKEPGQYALKLLLRKFNHDVLYEYKLPIESTENFPKGRLKNCEPHILPVSKSTAPTIRLCAPTIMARDAVGQYCRNTAEFLTAQGFKVQAYADNFDLSQFGQIRKYSELFEDICDEDIIVLVYSIFDPFLSKLSALPNKKMVMFQNVTPPDMLERWDPSTAIACTASATQFGVLEKFDKIYASTRYTALILQAFFEERKPVDLIPPFYHWQYPKVVAERPPRSPKIIKLLFVGRLVPNKRIDDLIKMYFEFLKFEWEATLTLVGSNWSAKYREYLDGLVTELGFREGQVNFAGSVSEAELTYHYQSSSAYVCLSEHEGYCIPIVEAMLAELPVFAYSHPAVSEVLGDAGVKIPDRNLWEWGERISLTLKDKSGVQRLLDKQNERVKNILKTANGDQIVKGLRELIESTATITKELK